MCTSGLGVTGLIIVLVCDYMFIKTRRGLKLLVNLLVKTLVDSGADGLWLEMTWCVWLGYYFVVIYT